MIDPHVAELSIAIEAMAAEAHSAEGLVADIRAAFPREPVLVLRRAILYATTDPSSRDDAVTLRLFDAAFSILADLDVRAG